MFSADFPWPPKTVPPLRRRPHTTLLEFRLRFSTQPFRKIADIKRTLELVSLNYAQEWREEHFCGVRLVQWTPPSTCICDPLSIGFECACVLQVSVEKELADGEDKDAGALNKGNRAMALA